MGQVSSKVWWENIKANPDEMIDWLKDQYHGEITAHDRIMDFVEQFSPENPRHKKTLELIADQEKRHAAWVGDLLSTRGITPAVLDKEERYWQQTLPQVDSFESAAAVASHAERMRLERIRVIVSDDTADADIRAVFARILPEEEFHERAFRGMAGGEAMQAALEAHLAGRAAIGLIPEDGFV